MSRKFMIAVCVAGGSVMGCKPATVTMINAETQEPFSRNDIAEAALKCRPATGVYSSLASVGVYDNWEERPIEPLITAQFKALDGKAMPLTLIYRFAGQDFEMPVMPTGGLTLEHRALDSEGGGDFCVVDPVRLNDPPGGLDLRIDTDFVFKKNLMGYGLETLEEGADLTTKYTARVIKHNMGAGKASAAGRANWIRIGQPFGANGAWTLPKNVFMNGEQISKTPEMRNGDNFSEFSLAEAKAIGLDRWVISGKNYRLSATFDPGKVADGYNAVIGAK